MNDEPARPAAHDAAPTRGTPREAADAPAPFKANDLYIAGGLLFLAAIAWCLPQRGWRRFCRIAAASNARQLAPNRAEIEAEIRRLRGERPLPYDIDTLLREAAGESVYASMLLLRAYRPGGALPRAELHGREHLDRALSQGRGAVLWGAYFMHGSVMQKKAFHDAGYAVSHLSRPSHGYSKTAWGIRTLNPVQTRIEDRFLKARVKVSGENATAAMRTLRTALGNNEIVSIAARAEAANPVTVAFMNGELSLATGAVDLAYAAEAPVIPVFTVRAPDGRFGVYLEEPLHVDRSLPRRAAGAQAIRRYAAQLETYVLKYPEQWLGWFFR